MIKQPDILITIDMLYILGCYAITENIQHNIHLDISLENRFNLSFARFFWHPWNKQLGNGTSKIRYVFGIGYATHMSNIHQNKKKQWMGNTMAITANKERSFSEQK